MKHDLLIHNILPHVRLHLRDFRKYIHACVQHGRAYHGQNHNKFRESKMYPYTVVSLRVDPETIVTRI